MTDHSEVRRDAERGLTDDERRWLYAMPAWGRDNGKKIEAKFDALLAELEQAEQREAALVEALRKIETMTPYANPESVVGSYLPHGPVAGIARAALAAHEQAKR